MLLLAASEYFYYTSPPLSHQKSTYPEKGYKTADSDDIFFLLLPANGIADSTIKQTCIYLFVFSVCTSSVYGWMDGEREMSIEKWKKVHENLLGPTMKRGGREKNKIKKGRGRLTTCCPTQWEKCVGYIRACVWGGGREKLSDTSNNTSCLEFFPFTWEE